MLRAQGFSNRQNPMLVIPAFAGMTNALKQFCRLG